MPRSADDARRQPAPGVDGVRARLAAARAVVALTGPCLGAGSVAGADPAADVEASLFYEDPVAVWRRYDGVRSRLAAAEPGPAHRALAALERGARAFTLATESTDGMHARAGSSAVVELHGSVWQVRCTRCGLRSVNRDVPIHLPPSCGACTGLVRPDVVWPGERAHEEGLIRCFEALSRCEVLLVAGSDAGRPPAASFLTVARRAGALCVLVAPAGASPPPSSPDVLLAGAPDEVLPLLVAR